MGNLELLVYLIRDIVVFTSLKLIHGIIPGQIDFHLVQQ